MTESRPPEAARRVSPWPYLISGLLMVGLPIGGYFAADGYARLKQRAAACFTQPVASYATAENFIVPMALTVAPDGRKVLLGGEDGGVYLWDATAAPPRKLFQISGSIFGYPELGIGAVAFMPGARRALVAGFTIQQTGPAEGVLEVLDLEAGALIKEALEDFRREGDQNAADENVLFPIEELCCVAVTPDGRYALTGGERPWLRLWDFEARTVKRLTGHTALITAVAVSPSGKLALSGSKGGESILWSLPDGALRQKLSAGGSRVTTVAFSADGRRALAATSGGSVGGGYLEPLIRGWDLARDPPAPTLDLPLPRETAGIVFSPDGQLALVMLSEPAPVSDKTRYVHELELWNLAAGARVRRYVLPEHGDINTSRFVAAFTPDGRQVVTARLWWNVAGEAGLEVLRWRVPSRFERWALGTEPQVAAP